MTKSQPPRPPLAIESATDAEIAWCAGLFEGEGWITLAHRRSTDRVPHASIGLSSTDEDVVDRFGALVGTRVTGPHTKSGTWNFKPYWHWQVGRHDDIGIILAKFWPWLGQRRRQRALEVREATHVFATMGPKKNPWAIPPHNSPGGAP